jgi:hypothetical protein
MVTSARSTAWHAVDLCYLSVARRVLVRLTRAGRRRLLLYPALLSLGAGVLVSCAADQPQTAPRASATRPMPPPHPEVSAPSRDVPRPARKPTPPSPVESETSAKGGEALAMIAPTPLGGAPASEAPPPPPEPAPVAASPGPLSLHASELIGLDQPAATRLFGPAAERSEEPPATVWRYRNATCELNLFFYLDLRSGRMRTLHYALKGNGSDPSGRQDCLQSLLAARGN